MNHTVITYTCRVPGCGGDQGPWTWREPTPPAAVRTFPTARTLAAYANLIDDTLTAHMATHGLQTFTIHATIRKETP